ncbi:MAG: ATP-binding protein [Verrucomicrobiota bacterium]|nr:ATP-binding protein [Verrucomicrobiota bacterium]
MSWVFAAVLAVALFAAWWLRRRFLRRWRLLETMIEQITAGGQARTFSPDGPARWLRVAEKLQRLADEQEQIRRRTPQEENLRIILASMDEGVIVADSRHAIRLVNPCFLRLFALEASPVGRTVLETLREPAFEEMVTAALTSGLPQSGEVMVEGRPHPRHFAVHAAPMHDAAGEPGVVAIVREITRLKQLEQVRREFVANVSHELRTPLSIFQGYVENLLDGPDLAREELVPVLEVMKKHSLRLNALVEDLVTLARLEAREARLQLAPMAMENFLRGVARDWAYQAASQCIGVEVDVPAQLPPVLADEFQLAQVCNNLVENALKYTGPGGRITLYAAALDGVVELRVADSGSGIPPADLPHIFERFYRADKARSREQGGTGLGLAIVKHIVQAHGGTVRAESTPGKGTSIILRLPAA